MARQALGKGLGALIKKTSKSSVPSQTVKSLPNLVKDAESVIQVKADELVASPFQPRRIFAEEQIQELAESMREHGLIQPLIVRKVENHYELIAGERRLRAARSIGMSEVRVVVHEATDLEVAELALIENLQREDLTPLEEAEQYKLLQTKFNLKQEVIAKHVGKTRTVVANMIRLLDLCPVVKELLSTKSISMGHAKVLLQLKDAEMQTQAAQAVVSKALTVRHLENLVRELLNPPTPAPKKEAPAVSEAYARACAQLSQDFGTRVHIATKSKNSGVIEINYSGKEDLARILQIFGVNETL